MIKTDQETIEELREENARLRAALDLAIECMHDKTKWTKEATLIIESAIKGEQNGN